MQEIILEVEDSIVIDDIEIKLTKVGRGSQVCLGVAAPKDVTILREELLEPDKT